MSLFNFFRKKKVDLTEDQRKWNKMWELWAEEQADAPYAQLMTYQSEINNGGHDQYFTNAENAADVQNEMSTLENILPAIHKDNLQKAYDQTGPSCHRSGPGSMTVIFRLCRSRCIRCLMRCSELRG